MINSVWVGEHLVDPGSLDKRDVDVIMSSKGLIPLTEFEREHIRSMALMLRTSNMAISALMEYIENTDGTNGAEEILSVAEELFLANEELISFDVDELGKGYKFK